MLILNVILFIHIEMIPKGKLLIEKFKNAIQLPSLLAVIEFNYYFICFFEYEGIFSR